MNIELPIELINTEEFKRKFWLNIDKINKTNEECWLWNASSTKYGSGKIRINESLYYATRIIWYLIYNEDPILCVLHKCDNPACCNPEHLFLGTTQDNTRDMINKGRNAIGENHGRAKLKEEDVLLIRKWYSNKDYNINELSLMFDINKASIRCIINRKSWKHI